MDSPVYTFTITVNPPACLTSNFPKVIGGSRGGTYIYQIDVFKDDLAFAGQSYDQLLTATSRLHAPIIGVIIISMPGTKFKWAKSNDR